MDKEDVTMSDLQVNIIAQSFVGPKEGKETEINLSGILKNPKNLKFMAKQDQLAVLATHNVLSQFPLTEDVLKEKVGIYLCMGNLAFEEKDLLKLATRSQQDGEFSMKSFATDALASINPLMTFRCLPNMSVFHISNNFGIHSTYFVTYSGRPQWAQALKKAINDLKRGKIEYALVGAIADQRNPLTRSYLAKRGVPAEVEVGDVAGMWLLTTKKVRPLLVLDSIAINYNGKAASFDDALKVESTPYLANATEYYNVHNWMKDSNNSESKEFSYQENGHHYSFVLKRGTP